MTELGHKSKEEESLLKFLQTIDLQRQIDCANSPGGIIYECKFTEVVSFFERRYRSFSVNYNVHFSLLQYIPTSTFVTLIKYCVCVYCNRQQWIKAKWEGER